jgi:hypothetical protein
MNWIKKHKIISGVIIFAVVILILASIGGSETNNQNSNSLKSSNTSSSEQPKTDQNSLLNSNQPDLKHLSTLTADYVGKTYNLYVNAKTGNYYNYGFNDENRYYSLTLWDNSIGEFDGVYGYIDRSDPKSKELVNKLLNGTSLLKITASIPTDRYEEGSNAFLLIDKWEEVK